MLLVLFAYQARAGKQAQTKMELTHMMMSSMMHLLLFKYKYKTWKNNEFFEKLFFLIFSLQLLPVGPYFLLVVVVVRRVIEIYSRLYCH